MMIWQRLFRSTVETAFSGHSPGPKRLSGIALRQALAKLRAEAPGTRARDAAQQLGVSEGELVASGCPDTAVRLRPEWQQILEAAPELKEVMVLTRNEHCVHEKVGTFGNVSIGPAHGLVLNHEIDLRLFLSHWHFGFAVEEETRSGLRNSLQFFDLDGTAVHKIYLREGSDRDAYERLLDRFRAEDQSGVIKVGPATPPKADRPDGDIAVDALKAHWRALQDTHDFFPMLQEFGVGRHQALRLVGDEFADPVEPGALRRMLNAAAEGQVPIMVFVGSPGCIQIHSGPVETLKASGPWFNVLDPGFNLHLREDRIETAWVVRKPTRDGTVTSLELYDASGQAFCQFFGERKPGQGELEGWRKVLADLPRLGASRAA